MAPISADLFNEPPTQDTSRDVRPARVDCKETPTAQNQVRLAAALLDAGQAEEAAKLYEGRLRGPFAADPDLRFGAAKAFVESQRYADALPHLRELSETRAEYAIWALATGDAATAARMQSEIDKITARWNAMNRELNDPVMRRLKAAHEIARRH